jgi:DUF971 family protein
VSNSQSIQPVSLAIADDRALLVKWSNGVEQKIPVRVLRDACPCATCRDLREKQAAVKTTAKKSSMLNILKPEELAPLQIQGMRPVGNYAYSIRFSDNHATGIFPFEFLFRLGEQGSGVTAPKE